MESNVKDSLVKVMNSTREYVKYRLLINAPEFNEAGLDQESGYILKYISSNYKCDSQITDMQGSIIQNVGNNGFEDTIKNGTKAAIKGNTVVNLKYGNNSIRGCNSSRKNKEIYRYLNKKTIFRHTKDIKQCR